MHIYIHTLIYIHTYTYMHIHTHTYINTYIRIYIHTYIRYIHSFIHLPPLLHLLTQLLNMILTILLTMINRLQMNNPVKLIFSRFINISHLRQPLRNVLTYLLLLRSTLLGIIIIKIKKLK